MNLAEQVQERLLTLQSSLLEQHPSMPGLLKEIHNTLKADPEVVTLLSEEELAIIVSGLQRITQTELSATIVKASKSSAALKKITVADL